jgi:magnesium-transporting ATPase (P-type)
MSVLRADKTSTLTQNALTVTTIRPMPGFDEAHVLVLAALASSEGGQDPVDGAIRSAASGKEISDAPRMIKSVPFDPTKKMSEATSRHPDGSAQRVVKGAFAVVSGPATASPTATAEAEELEGHGFRVLAIAAVELFVYAMTKFRGAYAAILGGLDAFVFTAGIGEHSAQPSERRQRSANSIVDSRDSVWVIPTNED